ncbi:MAG: nucleotidyltransferase domain-containing protein [Selenomonadales bacterium]|nr:nucleotidyltransferase domain-containing protein [Selenomonadales bacterium]
MRLEFDDLVLAKEYREAVLEAKKRLTEQYAVELLVVFGSVARGEADEESDLDLLVITKEMVTHRDRNVMSDIIFDVNYAYGTNLSLVVVDTFAWNKGVYSLIPLYSEVQRDGVIV